MWQTLEAAHLLVLLIVGVAVLGLHHFGDVLKRRNAGV